MEILDQVRWHYTTWTEQHEKRRNRENGWNDIIDAYWGKLPTNWPYFAQVVDPRIRTTILEKKGRLTNGKLRGSLVHREGGDIVRARINNAILEYQWDTATHGGTMNAKIGTLDQDARIFGSSFALIKWHREYDGSNLVFDSNELEVLDPQLVGLDPTCRNVDNAKWVQVVQFLTLEELREINDAPGTIAQDGEEKKPVFPGLEELEEKIHADKDGSIAQDRRDSVYTSRLLQLKGLEDKVGEDRAFPVLEIVTEYRPDRWITFSQRHGVILRDIPNPYAHRKIPLVQLSYYPLLDDPIGESEVEIVLPLWRAIQATICGFLDSLAIFLNPPLKILEGQVRMETIEQGPGAQWLVGRQDAVEEMRSSGDALRYFQTAYSALVAAFNQAMGDLSQGVSNVDPFSGDKTATEIRQVSRQQTARDQSNQAVLIDVIQKIMKMWLSNNQQFLFADVDKQEHILRIVGKSNFELFQKMGMDEMVLSDEASQMLAEIIAANPEMSDTELSQMAEAAMRPKFPVQTNPKEKDIKKQVFKPKMEVDEYGASADIAVVPDDLEGVYDYIPDIRSLSDALSVQQTQTKERILTQFVINPTVLSLLQQEGYVPKMQELLVGLYEDAGISDAERFFEQRQASPAPKGAQLPGGPANAGAQPGMAGGLEALPSEQTQQPLAGPQPTLA